MKAVFVMLVVAAFCSGCGRSGPGKPPNHTKFFETHDAGDYFRTAATTNGLRLGQVAHSHSYEGTAAQKDFMIMIRGDKTTRETLLHTYKDHLERELTSSGIAATGGNFNAIGAPTSGFAFHYRAPDLKGMIRVGSEIKNDYVVIDVFIYEHGNKN